MAAASDHDTLEHPESKSEELFSASKTPEVTLPEIGEWSEYITIELMDEKGFGVRAKKKISRGTVILKEMPLLLSPTTGYYCLPAKVELMGRFEALTPNEQNIVLSLATNPKKPLRTRMDLISNINETNRIAFDGGYSGVFPLASRINHSCIPNVHWCSAGDEAKPHLVAVIAFVDIDKGEEITASYVNHTNTCPQRQKQLEKGWNFKCTCGGCRNGPTKRRHEKAAQKLLKLRSKKSRSAEKELSLVKRQMKILRTEFRGSPRQIGQLSYVLAGLVCDLKDLAAYKYFVEVMEEHLAVVPQQCGKDFAQVQAKLKWKLGF